MQMDRKAFLRLIVSLFWKQNGRHIISLMANQRVIISKRPYISLIIVSPDESRGYLGFSTVKPPQRFPFGRDNLKNILNRPFKFGSGYIWAMPQRLLFCDLDLQFQGHWWSLKGQILAIFHILAQFSYTDRSSYGWYI